MTEKERLALITDVFNQVYASTDSFQEDGLGAELAYLFASIASGGQSDGVEWGADHQPHIDLFNQLFPAHHAVWRFIEITQDTSR